MNNNYKSGVATIGITGGTFIGFNPAAIPEGTGTSYVVGECTADSSTGSVVVSAATAQTDEHAAEVNGMYFKSLDIAFKAANKGATVKLLKDVNGNITVPALTNAVLDLNGYTIDGGTALGKAALTNYGTILITDNSEAGTGMIKRSDTGSPAYYTIQNEGVMTIAGGNVWNDSGYSDQWSGSSLICNGLKNAATLTISGGNISQGNFIAVKNDEKGTLSITGGTITSNTQAVQNWCEAEISGGELTGDVTTWAYSNIAGKTDITGGTINGDVGVYWYGEDSSYPTESGANPIAEIKGGTVTGSLIKGITTTGSDTRPTTAENAQGDIGVSGGKFENPVNELYLDDSLVYQAKDANGTYTYHDMLEKAIAAAGIGGEVSAVTGENRVVYTVTLKYNNGQTDSVNTYIQNETITLPTPTNSGYIFLGWRDNNNVTHKAGEAVIITAPDASSVSTWATNAMTWAMNIGLVEGDENGAVTPTATATRAQAAALIMRCLEA